MGTLTWRRTLLLRHRGRTGLTQRALAIRLGVDRRTVQDWEAGLKYPTAERLQGLLGVLLELGGMSGGREADEAQELWAAVEREAPRMHAPFDEPWYASLLGARDARPRAAVSDLRRAEPAAAPPEASTARRRDWGEAPDTTAFVGRADELATLSNWVVDEGSRLVAVLGMGGIGKTSLVARLAQEVSPAFERVHWRSLRDAPLPSDWLAGAIGFLSDQPLVPPAAEAERITELVRLLRQRRCLLVLDNLETLFEPGQREGRYRQSLVGYGRLLQAVGEARHQSCLVLTSREQLPELTALASNAVRTFTLGGLGVEDAEVLLAPKQLLGTNQQWAELTNRFGGNGLALKLVGERIRELFASDLGIFLEETGTGSVFGGIRRLLEQQVERSSAPEQQVLRMLAVEREPVTLAGVLASCGPRLGRGAVMEAVEALRRRSLIDRTETPGPPAFTLQSVVLEYVTNRLVDAAAEEIERREPVVLLEQPLIKAQAKDYVRQTQERLIGAPILRQLKERLGEDGTQQRLLLLLDGWRELTGEEHGFGPGNVVNLLRLLRGQLRGLDLSRLAIRQAYLAETDTHDASLVDAQLADSVLAEAFPIAHAVALSGDSTLLAAGTSTGELLLWRLADRTVLWTVQGHTDTVFSVALSADGQILASGSADGTVSVWQAATSRPLAMLRGHAGKVWSVALSADGQLLASGGADGTVRLWEASTGRPMETLQGHTSAVRGVALSGNGALLASGDEDGTVHLWDPSNGRSLAILHGHGGTVYSVALSGDGALLASAGEDGTVRLWNVSTGSLLTTLQAGTVGVWGVALTGDGELLVSGSADGTVRLWTATSGEPRAAVQGHSGAVFGVALSADGQLAASGGGDGKIKVWETSTSRPLATLHGRSGTLWGVALSADGQLAASGGGDGVLRLWETSTSRLLVTLHGHNGTLWDVALPAEGHLVASCAADATVRLWQVDTGRPLATLEGHTDAVLGVALSASGRLVASGGSDGTVRVWDARSGVCLAPWMPAPPRSGACRFRETASFSPLAPRMGWSDSGRPAPADF
jgi:WD40 repeat protein/transcriptional regulator with XRE-family HTH domain